jgi:hypothetical protein
MIRHNARPKAGDTRTSVRRFWWPTTMDLYDPINPRRLVGSVTVAWERVRVTETVWEGSSGGMWWNVTGIEAAHD